jgi:multidrug efflux pump subunit AcrA (membrane-fusion protein)
VRRALVAIAIACGCSGEPPGPLEPKRDFLAVEPGSPQLDFIKIEAVEDSDGAAAIALTGKVAFDEDHTQRLASPIDGRVTSLRVKPGERVKAGAPLVEVTPTRAGDPAARVTLRAPIAGTVVARDLFAGQEVRADAAQPLLTISDLDTVWVIADAWEPDLGLVDEGAAASLRVPAWPGVAFPAVIGHVGDVVDAQRRTIQIRCVAPNRDHRLKPEMLARVELTTRSQRKVVVIPSRAVIDEGEETKVIVAIEGHEFRERTVEVGPEIDGRVRVYGKLAVGEKIVTDGALFLKNEIRKQ